MSQLINWVRLGGFWWSFGAYLASLTALTLVLIALFWVKRHLYILDEEL